MKDIYINSIDEDGNGLGVVNNKKYIIPKTYIEDIVECEIIKETKYNVFGKLTKILKQSSDRIDNNICQYYNSCGGCNFLHLKEEVYEKIKKNKIINCINNIGYQKNIIDDLIKKIKFIKIGYNSRRRVTFHVKNGKLGFFENYSKQLVEINYCPLLLKEINDAIVNLKQIIKNNHNITDISITNYENGLELLLYINNDIDLHTNQVIIDFVKDEKNKIISVYYNLKEYTYLLYRREKPLIVFDGNIKCELDDNVFLQATEKGQKEITSIVVNNLKTYSNVIDLYCGIGTYSLPLSRFINNILAIEGSQEMINILNENIKLNKLYSKIKTQCRDLFQQPLLLDELNKYEAVIINPPRNGAQIQCKYLVNSNIKKIIMVSCNPNTFSIDAKELKNHYILKEVIGIDQFYKTKHLELVGIFDRK